MKTCLLATTGLFCLTAFLAHAEISSSAPTSTPVTPAASKPIDWPHLSHFRDANARLGPPQADEARVVFMGDSITSRWDLGRAFHGKPYINRGISAQTSPQMLLRFRQDVVALRPKAVVILAGTNDIAGNTGPSSLEMIEDNFASMTEIAQSNGIAVILASVLPASTFYWNEDLKPAKEIIALNAWLKTYAAEHHGIYLDYHSALTNEQGGLSPEYSADGVHPAEAGYAIMQPLAERAIDQALSQSR